MKIPGAKYGVSSSVKLMMHHGSVVRAGSYFSQSVLIFSGALELHFSGYKTLLTPQRAWWGKKKKTVIWWNMILRAGSRSVTTSTVLAAGFSTNNGSFALQTRAAHYLLRRGNTYQQMAVGMFTILPTKPEERPWSAVCPALSINDCSGRGRERVMDAGQWRLSLLSCVMEWEKSAFACGLGCGWLNSPVSPQSR